MYIDNLLFSNPQPSFEYSKHNMVLPTPATTTNNMKSSFYLQAQTPLQQQLPKFSLPPITELLKEPRDKTIPHTVPALVQSSSPTPISVNGSTSSLSSLSSPATPSAPLMMRQMSQDQPLSPRSSPRQVSGPQYQPQPQPLQPLIGQQVLTHHQFGSQESISAYSHQSARYQQPSRGSANLTPSPTNSAVSVPMAVPYYSPINSTLQQSNTSGPILLDEKVANSQMRKKRQNLPRQTTLILLTWLSEHLDRPYPNSREKYDLIMKTRLSIQQLDNWFINARRRKINILRKLKENDQSISLTF